MKKVLLGLIVGSLLASNLLAEELACSQQQYNKLVNENDSILAGEGMSGEKVLIEKKNLSYDKKTQIAELWIANQVLASQKSKLGGLYKIHLKIDFKNKKDYTMDIYSFDCNGRVIQSIPGDKVWSSYPPNSKTDIVAETLKEHFKIK